MSTLALWVLIALVGIPAGIVAGYFLRRAWAVREAQSAEAKAQVLLDEAKAKEREVLIKAKDQAIKIIDDAKREEVNRHAELQRLQERLEKRESLFDQKSMDFERDRKEVEAKSTKIDELKAEVAKIREDQLKKLETIAGLTQDDAKRVLVENTELRMKDELLSRIRKIQSQSEEDVEREARKVLSTAMQRLASNQSTENSTTVVDLPNE